MARNKKPKLAKTQATPEELDNKKRELFCQYYAKGDGTFGNATLAYSAAYEIELSVLMRASTQSGVHCCWAR